MKNIEEAILNVRIQQSFQLHTILFLIFLIFKDQWDRFEEIAEENIAKLWLSENI